MASIPKGVTGLFYLKGYSEKDTLDWLEYIRKEIEGSKGMQVNIQSAETKILIIRPSGEKVEMK